MPKSAQVGPEVLALLLEVWKLKLSEKNRQISGASFPILPAERGAYFSVCPSFRYNIGNYFPLFYLIHFQVSGNNAFSKCPKYHFTNHSFLDIHLNEDNSCRITIFLYNGTKQLFVLFFQAGFKISWFTSLVYVETIESHVEL